MPKCPFISASGTSVTHVTEVTTILVDENGINYTKQIDDTYKDDSIPTPQTPAENGATHIVAVIVDSSTTSTIGANDCIQSTACQQWDPDRNECGLNSKGQSSSIPVATVLMTEFFNGENRDGKSTVALQTLNSEIQGSIYGVHFQIDELSDGFPTVLNSVHAHGDFDTRAPAITWAQYLSI